jgi:phosphoglycolate phosphatase-like HAD superfamily hydrolase
MQWHRWCALWWLMSAFCATACGTQEAAAESAPQRATAPLTIDEAASAPPPAAPAPTGAVAAPFASCPPAVFAGGPIQPFAADINRALSARSAHHGSSDAIVAPGDSAQLVAWFDYGLWMQPMATEQVSIFGHGCGGAWPGGPAGWTHLGDATTDASGRASMRVQPNLAGPSRVDLMFEMRGDGTRAQSSLFVLPPGTQFIVFDIDGTLSQNNRAFIEEILEHMAQRTCWPEAFPDAANLTRAWRDKGYIPLYLTNRPHQLADITRAWLAVKGFAEGPLLVSDSLYDLVPRNDGAGAYKLQALRALQGRGYDILYAYGNEPTDIYAYSYAGIPNDHIFSIGTHAGIGGSQPLVESYTQHLQFVATQPSGIPAKSSAQRL